MPKVSICVPNLNTRPFLAERFRTILEQTWQDWELLVYDSHSDDGAWEYICDIANRDRRILAWQGPRGGTPGSWSPCIRKACGDYVYIATSDDTMPPDCLEQLVGALDAHPECDVAHCPLQAIDETGREIEKMAAWWSQDSIFAQSSGRLLWQPHVRKAPYDGLLHLSGGSVYISITQLLIRRSLFDRIGFFESTWGSVGDFGWNMRAGLVANTVHVPGTWGGWRLHGAQATAAVELASADHATRIDQMIDQAISSCGSMVTPALRVHLDSWSSSAKALRDLARQVATHDSAVARRRYVIQRAATGSAPARTYLTSRLMGRSFPDLIQGWLDKVGQGPMLVPTAGMRTPTASVPGR
jgi:hypothetical protein